MNDATPLDLSRPHHVERFHFAAARGGDAGY